MFNNMLSNKHKMLHNFFICHTKCNASPPSFSVAALLCPFVGTVCGTTCNSSHTESGEKVHTFNCNKPMERTVCVCVCVCLCVCVVLPPGSGIHTLAINPYHFPSCHQPAVYIFGFLTYLLPVC